MEKKNHRILLVYYTMLAKKGIIQNKNRPLLIITYQLSIDNAGYPPCIELDYQIKVYVITKN